MSVMSWDSRLVRKASRGFLGPCTEINLWEEEGRWREVPSCDYLGVHGNDIPIHHCFIVPLTEDGRNGSVEIRSHQRCMYSLKREGKTCLCSTAIYQKYAFIKGLLGH